MKQKEIYTYIFFLLPKKGAYCRECSSGNSAVQPVIFSVSVYLNQSLFNLFLFMQALVVSCLLLLQIMQQKKLYRWTISLFTCFFRIKYVK